MGFSHIPEDRHKHGLVLDYTLEDNLVLQTYFLPEYTNKFGFLRRDNIRKKADDLIERFDIRSGQGAITSARSMSGGNQQKAIVARELDKDPELLIPKLVLGGTTNPEFVPRALWSSPVCLQRSVR